MSQPAPQSTPQPPPQPFQQQLKTAQQRSNLYYKQLRKQIEIEQQKINRWKKKTQTRAYRVYKKSLVNQYVGEGGEGSEGSEVGTQGTEGRERREELEVPVDGELQRGSRVFMANCAGCHALAPTSETNNIGPSLGLIHNRKAGSDKTYQAYSEPMIKTQKYWTTQTLYRFLHSPQSIIPGTKCSIAGGLGLKSQQDRADLLQFLKQYSSQLSKHIKIRLIQSKGYDVYQTELYAKEKGYVREDLRYSDGGER